MKRRLLSVITAAGLVFAGAGCGKGKASNVATPSNSAGTTPTSTCPSTETATAAKTRFVLHAGLASGAFYHWIYQPLRAGSFSSGAPGRTRTIIKGGLAAIFVVHELDVAKSDAEADPALCKVLVAPIVAVHNAIDNEVARIRGGDVSPADLAPVDQEFNNLKGQASQAGSAFTDQIPSLGQLANPSSTGS